MEKLKINSRGRMQYDAQSIEQTWHYPKHSNIGSCQYLFMIGGAPV